MAFRVLRRSGQLFTQVAPRRTAESILYSSRCFRLGSKTLQQPETSFCDVSGTSISTLPNGLRIASENTNNIPTCTVGLWIDAGTRYENDQNNGVAHFLEHMAFKGTKSRSRTQLELEIENMGAHLNAYTSREQTVYYCRCLAQDVDRAMNILSDILLRSTYKKDAIEQERHTILREVQEIEFTLQETTFDFLHAVAFQGSRLAYTILGPEHIINSLQRDDLVQFVKDHYTGPRMVVAAAGGVDHSHLIKLSDEYFGHLAGSAGISQESLLPDRGQFTGDRYVHKDNNMPQVHCAIAVEGPGWKDADNVPLMVANSLVGSFDHSMLGPGASTHSKLAAVCAQQNICHSFLQFSTCYIETGLWGIYFVCDVSQTGKLVDAISSEWMRLCTEVTDEEVHRGKNLVKANMLLQLDGSTPVCEEIGRHLLCYGRRVPLQEMEARIDMVDAATIRRVCSKYLIGKKAAVAALGPTDLLPDNISF